MCRPYFGRDSIVLLKIEMFETYFPFYFWGKFRWSYPRRVHSAAYGVGVAGAPNLVCGSRSALGTGSLAPASGNLERVMVYPMSCPAVPGSSEAAAIRMSPSGVPEQCRNVGMGAGVGKFPFALLRADYGFAQDGAGGHYTPPAGLKQRMTPRYHQAIGSPVGLNHLLFTASGGTSIQPFGASTKRLLRKRTCQ